MKRREITAGVDLLGAIHWDRRSFDELIPLPDGTSYNSYLVRGGKKTALIDTVDPTKSGILLEQIADVPRIDYMIVQHVEQDHSGTVPVVLARHPEARVIATPKAKGMIVDHLGVAPDRINPVDDGETLSLGDRTLEFIHAPWVHWPETMLTYLREDRILFTCDLFGAHLATSELYAHDRARVHESAKRYYAEIMMPFSRTIAGHLDRLGGYSIASIAPSHGPVYDDPSFILDAYRDWVGAPPQNLVLIPYTSMHGSTERMVAHLVGALTDRGVVVEPFNLAVTDIGAYTIRLVDAATVIFATPTVLSGPHPNALFTAYLTAALRPKLRHGGIIGSYGWGGKAVEVIRDLCKTLQVDWFEPVIARGLPTLETLAELDGLADAIVERHRALESVR